MKTYELELTEEELKVLAQYTQAYADFRKGHVEELANKGFSYYMYNLDIEGISDKFKQLENKIKLFKDIEFIEHIAQIMKYNYAYGKYPNGGVTSWFSKPKKINEKICFSINKE